VVDYKEKGFFLKKSGNGGTLKPLKLLVAQGIIWNSTVAELTAFKKNS
jgi:hypothetical protein